MATQQYQIGGWYNGRQWNGSSFGAPGQITVGEAAGTMVNPTVVAASNKAQGLAPGTNEAFLAKQGASGYSSQISGSVSGGGVDQASTDPYTQAATDIKAQIPLIQQRYKSLYDEIDRAATESTQAEQKASEGSISEARARAGAAGVYSGSTELGTETNIREQASAVIRNIKETGASKKAQATAQEAIDIGQITEKLGNLAIAKDKADRDAAQFAMEYILKEKQLAIDATKAAKTGVGSNISLLKDLFTANEPSSKQQDAKDAALVGLESIKTIRNLGTVSPEALRRASINPILALSDPTARQLGTELNNVKDLLTRARTGAALNESEQAFYNSFINNPLQAVLGFNEGQQAAINIMESIFNKAVQRGTNPYADLYNNSIKAELGIAGTPNTTSGGSSNDPLGIR